MEWDGVCRATVRMDQGMSREWAGEEDLDVRDHVYQFQVMLPLEIDSE